MRKEQKNNILRFNNPRLLEDIYKVRDVMVYVEQSNAYLKVRKMDVLQEAEDRNISYRMTDAIFVVKREVMLVL